MSNPLPILPVPVIDCTDLYHPHQDPGDNFDILTAYALPEIDLKAVVLDVTEDFRQPSALAGEHPDPYGPRDAGVIPMMQVNWIFDRSVPFALSPFHRMKSPDDAMLDAPRFQQAGIDLMIRTLRQSDRPVVIMVFCSCRTLAAAINREPQLFRQKVKRLILSIGCTRGERFDLDWAHRRPLAVKPGSSGYLEWNVMLDPHAFVRVLRSGLPMSIYPCASECGPFSLHRHNSFYQLGSLGFVRKMHPRLRSYLAYAFNRTLRHDFLRAMEQDPTEAELATLDAKTWHPVWETAPWLEASGRLLVRRADGSHRILPGHEIDAADTRLPNHLRPCELNVHDDGRFHFRLTDGDSSTAIYDRGDDLAGHEKAMAEALKALYLGFVP